MDLCNKAINNSTYDELQAALIYFKGQQINNIKLISKSIINWVFISSEGNTWSDIPSHPPLTHRIKKIEAALNKISSPQQV